MIILGDKNKSLVFDVQTEGLKTDNIKFKFCIEADKFGVIIKGVLIENNKVKIDVPAGISTLENLTLTESYDAKLEVIVDDKHYRTPWTGKVQIETEPKVNVTLENITQKEDIKIESTKMSDPEIIEEAESKESFVESILGSNKKRKPIKESTIQNKRKGNSLLDEILHQ